MSTTANSTRKTVAELLAEHAQDLIPVDGDRAYTFYHGLLWEGVLKEVPWNGKEGWGGGFVIIPANGEKVFGHHQGRYKNYEGLPTANVGVYCGAHYADREDDWHADIQKMGHETPNRMMAYDVKRGMFYLRAHED